MLKKTKQLSEKQKLALITFLVGILAFLVAANVLRGFLLGDDEAMFMTTAKQIFYEWTHGDLKDVWFVILHHDHSPAPILILMSSIAIFGFNEIALRLPNVLLWAAVCMVTVRIGWRLGGLRVGTLSGLILAVSGIYDLEALGFGMSVEVLSVSLMINVLLDNFSWHLETPEARKKYLLGGTYLAIGTLFYTSTMPVVGLYHAWFALQAYRTRPNLETIKKYILNTLPFVGFYLLYNLIFLGIPAYEVYTQGIQPYGQLMHSVSRTSSFLNYSSLLSNLKVLNWFVLPFISWAILGIAIYYQTQKYPNLFIILLGFGAIWSFYLYKNTGQHFLAYFCWLLPFGITAIIKLSQKWNTYYQVGLWGSLLALTFSWTYVAHIKIYTYASYPRDLVSASWSEPLGWTNNIYRPVYEIAGALKDRLGPKGTYISTIDSAFSLVYYPNDYQNLPTDQIQIESHSSPTGECMWMSLDTIKANKIRAVVSYTDQSVCSELVDETLDYPGSNLKLTFLK